MKKIDCVVPVYNEADTLIPLLQTLIQVPAIDNLICVNDGSSDASLHKLQAFASEITLISLKKNAGKTGAVRAGVALAQSDSILLFDSDLANFSADDISQAITTYHQLDYDMIILQLPNAYRIFNFLRTNVIIAGQRILPKAHLETVLSRPVHRYQLELTINDHMLSHHKKVGVLPFTADHTHKVSKYGWRHGLHELYKEGHDLLLKNPRHLLQSFTFHPEVIALPSE